MAYRVTIDDARMRTDLEQLALEHAGDPQLVEAIASILEDLAAGRKFTAFQRARSLFPLRTPPRDLRA